MTQTTQTERIRNAKIEEMLGERGAKERRAVRQSELAAALAEIERLKALYDALAKRVTALEP